MGGLSITSINNSIHELDSPCWFSPYKELENRIIEIAHKPLQGSLSSQQKADLQQGFKLAHGWTWPAGRMQKILSNLPKESIKAFMIELMAADNDADIEYYLERCLSFLDKKSLLEISGFETTEMAITTFNVQGYTKLAALRNSFEKEGRVIWNEFLLEVKHFIYQFLDILVTLTGVNEVVKKRRREEGGLSSYEASSKINMYVKFLAYPATIFGMIYSYIEYKTTALLLTSLTIIATLGSVVAYTRYLKPCPTEHSGLKNLTIDLIRNNKPIYPRQDILKKIEVCFQAGKSVIIVGPPGTGKSQIGRSFAQQAKAGKICAFIKNFQFFSCNGASFTFGEGTSFPSIEERFKGYEDNFGLFIDEMHALFQENKVLGNSAGEQIKTFCENFKYVIGATTTEEYEKFIKNKPTITDRRFEIIHINPMDNDQITMSLYQHLEHQNSKINFDPSVIDHIINNTGRFNPNTSQVDAAHTLLNCAIQKMESVVNHALVEKVIHLEDQLGVMEQKANSGVAIHDLKQMQELESQIVKKKGEIEIAKNELHKNNSRTRQMQKMEAYHLKLKQQSFNLAQPNYALANDAMLTKKWIELHGRMKAVGEFIANERAALGLPKCLNIELIESIIQGRQV